jgi:hypothetical protein
MKKILIAVLALGLTATAGQARTVGCAVVIKPSDLRNLPNIDEPSSFRLSNGDVLILSNNGEGEWLQGATRKGGHEGYVRARDLRWIDCPEYKSPAQRGVPAALEWDRTHSSNRSTRIQTNFGPIPACATCSKGC